MHIFDVLTGKWSKLQSTGCIPECRECHSAIFMKPNEIIILFGIDRETMCENNYIFHTDKKHWDKLKDEGEVPCARESHSATLIKNDIYLYGGQDNSEEILSDLYRGSLLKRKGSSEGELEYILNWERIWSFDIEIAATSEREGERGEHSLTKVGKGPCGRTSHAAVVYDDRYLIVLGGEGLSKHITINKNKIPQTQTEDLSQVNRCAFNDVWIFDTLQNHWKEVKIDNSAAFKPRFSHSASLSDEKIYVFGGMHNSDLIYSELSVLCLDSQLPKNVLVRPEKESILTGKEGQTKLPNSNGVLYVSNLVQETPLQNKKGKPLQNLEEASENQKIFLKNVAISPVFLNNLCYWQEWAFGN